MNWLWETMFLRKSVTNGKNGNFRLICPVSGIYLTLVARKRSESSPMHMDHNTIQFFRRIFVVSQEKFTGIKYSNRNWIFFKFEYIPPVLIFFKHRDINDFICRSFWKHRLEFLKHLLCIWRVIHLEALKFWNWFC